MSKVCFHVIYITEDMLKMSEDTIVVSNAIHLVHHHVFNIDWLETKTASYIMRLFVLLGLQ